MAEIAKQVSGFVKYKITQLYESNNESLAKATLAKLRRGIGKPPGSLPELWDITLNGLPDELLSKNGEPTYSEWAIHTTLTLYALHQQGKDLKNQCMNKKGEFLGIAARRLLEQDKNNEEAIKRRFQTTVISGSYERLSWQLRGLVQLLKSKSIPIDYPNLAKNLYWFQFPDIRDSLRLSWGQDFYRISKNKEKTN